MTDTTQQVTGAPEETGSSEAGGCGCGGCGCGGAAQDAGSGTRGERQEGLQIVAGPDRGTTAATGTVADALGTSDALVEPGDLDLRSLPRPERHARVFAVVGGLLPGEGVVLANDHDPVGLRRQLEEQDLGHLGWQYLAQGPDVWRVLVSRDTCC
ncbi:DUF2249 domain-containing protein [Actinotalea sp. Marseille-Q4924]|uniref:DUF2249 domain-containing protein n=1 Tax=Actinotalea sp. Marseille-Q4924 TaxID=2866571 RepID=UPI001CE449D4|nr:DUF2249 domain-containing protein [Actinotalea sp. Marseille-Q4924]